jgi:cell shape-determining protein MreC
MLRYEPVLSEDPYQSNQYAEMEELKLGEYVKHEDYQILESKIAEFEKELTKYKDLYDLAIAMDYPKKQTKILMGNAANKTIRQQFEEQRPFIEDCARDGMTMAQIAKRLDVTPIRLANAFKSLDISINRLRSEGARLC